MYINITGSKDNKAEMMDWSKKEAEKETLLYNQCKERVTVSFSLSHVFLQTKNTFLTSLSVPAAALHRIKAGQHLQKYPQSS